jgi:type II secretory pathway component HofQ
MPTFKLPLSGDVVQTISPWTAFMSPIGSQIGLVNVTVGQSSEPAVEADVLSDVAGYGKQLGRIEDALVVLLEHFHPVTPLTADEAEAIDDLKEMLDRIASAKEKHKRKALRLRAQQAPAPSSAQATAGTPASAPPAESASSEAPPPTTPGKPSRRPGKST